jgi:hypothetical protein
MKRKRGVGHVALMEDRRDAFRVLVRRSEGKRPRHRCENNIKMNLQEVQW